MLDDVAHVGHGGGEQGAAGDDGGALGDAFVELGDVAVDAEVDDVVAGALEHDGDEVLADVVEVALDGADGDGPEGLAAGGGEEGLDDGEAGLHGAGGDEQLGDVGLVAGELLADLAHGGDHGLVEEGVEVFAGVDGGLDDGGHVVAAAFDDGGFQGIVVGHG